MEEGVRAGVFRGVHARLVAEVLLVAVARIVDPDLLSGCDLTMSQAFGALYDIFEYGLTPPSAGDDRGKGDGAAPRRSAAKGRAAVAGGTELRRPAASVISPDREIGEDELWGEPWRVRVHMAGSGTRDLPSSSLTRS